ncbi:hypothetical protein MSP7336_04696 [Mycobacterium shimoidei]|uniref:Uncharacterized protein n=1 Tax=Mycobacterium shimoidei TaxID=29313 RepID=A0A375Z5K7_MYCSH|nr:hypothetical protein MSP7336_04696 [Mycobacterium shimoidei]
MQCGIQNRRMHSKPGRRCSRLGRHCDFGEYLVAAAPHRGESLERRTVLVATLGQLVVHTAHIDRCGTDRRPRGQIRARFDASGAELSFGVEHPVRVGVGARKHRYRTRPRFLRTADHDLHGDRTGGRQHQRRGQHQLLDDAATDFVAGPNHQFDEPGTREQDHTADRMIGQPRLRRGREPAGQHYPTRRRQIDDRTQQRMLG